MQFLEDSSSEEKEYDENTYKKNLIALAHLFIYDHITHGIVYWVH